ncbi:cupin domain-containing protein [Xanthobacter autotrophicus DSM 431]|uniref:cupin domain-containing protein n=1 Tax=Xanthobacter nonsaccharivorans TaxID=3119912 RepID=UPI003726A813
MSNHETIQPNYLSFPSTLVNVGTMEWKPTKYPGIEIKVLLKDEQSGLLTALFRWAPGSMLPLHEHVEVEQTFVLEGSFEDDEGEVTAGNYVSRPAGSRHVARSPRGAIILSFFLKPNVFFGASGEKEVFDARRS